LKTESSNRLIPIHQNLIDWGLLDYVNSRRDGHLWAHLSKDKYGDYGRNLGRWFNSQLRKMDIKNKKLTFHSFRHTFTDKLKQADVKDGRISELTGHVDGNITTGRYGEPYRPKEQYSVIEMLDIPIASHNKEHNGNENENDD
jgi:integrase